MSRRMGKTTICICKNKDPDQLRSNCQADQRLCFGYMDSAMPLLLISKISSFWTGPVTVQAGLYQTWSETQIVGFLMSWNNLSCISIICGRGKLFQDRYMYTLHPYLDFICVVCSLLHWLSRG